MRREKGRHRIGAVSCGTTAPNSLRFDYRSAASNGRDRMIRISPIRFTASRRIRFAASLSLARTTALARDAGRRRLPNLMNAISYSLVGGETEELESCIGRLPLTVDWRRAASPCDVFGSRFRAGLRVQQPERLLPHQVKNGLAFALARRVLKKALSRSREGGGEHA